MTECNSYFYGITIQNYVLYLFLCIYKYPIKFLVYLIHLIEEA